METKGKTDDGFQEVELQRDSEASVRLQRLLLSD